MSAAQTQHHLVGDEYNIVKECSRCDGEFLVSKDWAARCDYCHDCVDAIRREQRATAPKCECCSRRRGTWKISGVLVCGRCKTTIQRNRERQLSGFGALALVVALDSAPLSRDEILDLAKAR
jgi:hypothetical protein